MATDYQALKSGGFMPQAQKDHFSLRLSVTGGSLSSNQLAAIAGIAERYGDGRVHLTSRQAVEIPFIKLADIEAVRSELKVGGLRTAAIGPVVRTVTACQGSEVCPHACIETQGLARRISERYADQTLPHKFKIGVTGCVNNCLKAEQNDLGVKGGYVVSWDEDSCSECGLCVEACKYGALTEDDDGIHMDKDKCTNCGRCVQACGTGSLSGEQGYLLSFGGTFGNSIAIGRQILPIITDQEAMLRTIDTALGFFDEHGKRGERFRAAIERVGWDALASELEEAKNG